MVDTVTTFLSLIKQTIGGNRNTWGNILNDNMDLVDAGIAGLHAVATTGGDTTLADTEWINRIIEVTGTLSSNAVIIFPNESGFWIVRNGTTGGSYTVTCKTASGSAVEVIRGGFTLVWGDGNDVMRVGPSSTFLDTQVRAPSGTLAAPGLSWLAELGSGFYRVSSGVFAWVVGGVARLSVSATGLNVIGSLHLNGASAIPVGVEMDFPGPVSPNGWLFIYAQTLSRTTYSELLEALTIVPTVTRNGTTTLSEVSIDMSALGLVGSKIEGTGIATGTTITEITATTITLSQAASGSATMTARIFPLGMDVGDGATTFTLHDARDYVTAGRATMGGGDSNRLTTAGGGLTGNFLGGTGGSETHTLTTAQIPAHAHTASAVSNSSSSSVSNSSSSSSSSTSVFISDPGHSHTQTVAFNTSNSPGGAGNSYFQSNTSSATSHNTTGITASASTSTSTSTTTTTSTSTTTTTTVTVNNAGGGEAHPNVQPTRIVNKIIFTNVFA
jgi:microcystin-dependent protein